MRYLVALLLAWFALGCSATALVGHYCGNLILASWRPGQLPMSVSTACVTLALAASTLLRIFCHKEDKRHGGKHD